MTWRWGSETDLLYLLLVSLAKSIHLSAEAGKLLGKENLRELHAGVQRDGEVSACQGALREIAAHSHVPNRALGEGRRSLGEGDPSISSGSLKKHFQAEAKFNSCSVDCFV